MKIVRENINFERGLNPKVSMDIGKSKLDRELIEKTDWAIDILKHQHIYDILQVIHNYKGYPVIVLKEKGERSWPYRAISIKGFFTDFNPTPEKALREMLDIIDNIDTQKPNK